jgi:nitrous oxide reductase accessory protein NosL
MKKLIMPEQVQDQKKGHYKSFIVPNQAGEKEEYLLRTKSKNGKDHRRRT